MGLEREDKGIVEHDATLHVDEVAEFVWCGSAWHNGFNGLNLVRGGDGMAVGTCHVASVPWGVHDYVLMADTELCRMCALREGRPKPRRVCGWWRAVRGRLRTEETVERSASRLCA
jgi:hypothetical protein